MKKVILLLSFILLFTTTFAQKREAIITFKDSSTKKGLAKIEYAKIKFKANKKAKKQLFDHTTVNHMLIKNPSSDNYLKFYYKKVDVFNEYHLLKLYKQGNISIYFEHSESNDSAIALGLLFGIAGVAIASSIPNKITPLNKRNYYLCKNESESVFFFSNRNKKFKAEASVYFNDCSNLVTKINDGEFTKNHIAEMINFYNTKCQ